MERGIGYWAALGALISLVACGGAEETPTQRVALGVNGFDISIVRAGDGFRVARTDDEFRPERDFVYTAIAATERVTGCRVRRETIAGGPARLRGRLDC